MGSPQTTVQTVLILLLVVFAVGLAAQRLRLPYPIALVLTGLLGFQPGYQHIRLTPNLILTVFLPVLLFEGAYNVSAKALWHNLLPVGLLAAPGVLLGMLVTGTFVHLVLGLGWGVALLFGALIASTDPIAVVSLFRDLGVSRRLTLLVEGESLLNDGASITLFQIALIAVVSGTFSVGEGLLRFVVTVAGALAVGALIGYGASRALRWLEQAQMQLTATIIAAYGAYLLAEHLTFSGPIAVVVTGLLVGNYGATAGLRLDAVRALHATWEFLGFVANALIFLLIGIELDPGTLARNGGAIALAFLGSLLGRAVAVYALLPWLRGRMSIPRSFRPVLLWGGLRGAVSLALVLSLPIALPTGQAFPDRERLQIIAFGVVGVSLTLQGLTMRPLIQLLGLLEAPATAAAHGERELLAARLRAIDAQLFALAREHEQGEIGTLHYRRLTQAYKLERADIRRRLRGLPAPEEATEDT